MTAREVFSFPRVLNDKATRFVAGVVSLATVVTLVTGWYWLLIPLAYGFWARVLTGPTLNPLGWVATNYVAPKFFGERRPVSGPPKRFAQAMGTTFSTSALILVLLGLTTAADVVLVVLFAAAFLESAFGFCLGCKTFAILMRFGVIPPETCAECADVSARLRSAQAQHVTQQ